MVAAVSILFSVPVLPTPPLLAYIPIDIPPPPERFH